MYSYEDILDALSSWNGRHPTEQDKTMAAQAEVT
jgi:hypothetical protein